MGWLGAKSYGRVYESVLHCRLAANSIQKHIKKGRSPKTFFPGLQVSRKDRVRRQRKLELPFNTCILHGVIAQRSVIDLIYHYIGL